MQTARAVAASEIAAYRQEPRRLIPQCDAMGARAFDADGLEAAVDRQTGCSGPPSIRASQPASKVRAITRSHVPVVVDRGRRAVPRDEPGGRCVGARGNGILGQEQGQIEVVERERGDRSVHRRGRSSGLAWPRALRETARPSLTIDQTRWAGSVGPRLTI